MKLKRRLVEKKYGALIEGHVCGAAGLTGHRANPVCGRRQQSGRPV